MPGKAFVAQHRLGTVPTTPNPLRLTEAGRSAAGPLWHNALIHLALGNRHLSLRMPLGTHRQGLI